METFYWSTEYAHRDNTHTMTEYLDQHLPLDFTIVYQDGTMAEIRNKNSGLNYGVHASGAGGSFNHKVEFVDLF